MKKRMLALLLTLCMVVSLLPAQLVSADMASNVTIKGNGSKFVLYKDGAAISGLTQNYELNVPAGSTLRNEGYEVRDWDRDLQYFVSWSANGVDLGNDAAMLDYVIPASGVVFEAGWVGAGGGYHWSLFADKTTVNVGDIVTLTTDEPADGPFQFCEWHVSDPDLAHVSGYGNHGTMQALAPGKVTVSLKTAIGIRSVEITINATQGGNDSLALGDNNLLSGNSVIHATFTPYWGDGEYVFFVEDLSANWSINFDEDVDIFGHDTFGASGFRVDLIEGVTYHVEIINHTGKELRMRMMKISPDAPDLAFPQDTQDHAYIGDEWGFPVLSVAPDGKIGNNIQWSVDAPAVVDMTFDGNHVNLKFLSPGVVTLTAVDVDNNKSVSHTITVYDPNDPNAGPGTGGGNPDASYFEIDGRDGEFFVTDSMSTFPASHIRLEVPKGATLEEAIFAFSDPVFWDGNRAFLGWMACTLEELTDPEGNVWLDYVQIPGTQLMTSAEIVKYPSCADRDIIFIAQWEGDEEDYYSHINFDTLGGQLTFGNRDWEETSDSLGHRVRRNQATYGEGMDFTILSDPTHSDYVFEGWLKYDWYTMELVSDTLFTTQEAFNTEVLPGGVIFIAKWDGIPMDDYRNLFQGGGDDWNVEIWAFDPGLEAEFTITNGGDAFTGNGIYLPIPTGSSLKAEGYDVKDMVFWEPSRQFVGWNVYTAVPYYEEGQFMWNEWVQVPGTTTMTTAEMLNYPIEADELYYFLGQWSGDDSDYYSSVAFDGFGGEFDIYFGGEHWYTADWDNFHYNREGYPIGDECSRYFDGALDVVNMRSERGDFRGWIQYTWSDENGWTMVEREDNLVTWEALELLVPEEDTVFVARWEGVSWDEYLNYGKNQGGEGEGGFEFPEDATYTELLLDQKAPLLGEQENYYTFTAPADGYYSLCYDSFQTGVDIWDNLDNYFWVMPETGKIVIYLEAGQEYVFRAVAALDCQIWVEKALAITELEILEFDASKTVLKTNEWMWAYLLNGMTVKATFEDGTTKTVTMPNEIGEYTLNGYEPMLEYDFENTTGTTGVVTLHYGDASDTFTVKLLDKKVTAVEVVPGTLEVTEYTLGWLREMESGFVFEYQFPRILEEKGTLRFTWSDNTTETLAYDANNPYFYGLYLGYDHAPEIWTAGNTYDVSIYYGGVESSVAVKILESSVEKLEIVNDITAALCEPEFAQNPDGSWCLDGVDLTEMEFKVTFKDQTSKTYKFSDLREDRYDYYAGDYPIYLGALDYALLDNITGPCEIPLILMVGGKSAELNIHVVEKLVEDNQTTVGSPAIDEALKNETDGEIVVDGTSSEQGDANVPTVNLPATSLDKVADAGVDMTVKMDNAQVTFDQKAVESIAQQAGEAEAAQVQLSVEAVPMDQLTDKQRHKIESVMKNSDETPLVLDITLSVGEETISNFHGGNATIRVPFTPAEGSDGEDYAVWYIPEDGKQVQKMKTTYEDGYLIFTTNHFSEYVAMKEDLSAGDETGDVIPGDMNGDGVVTDKDVIALLWNVLFPGSNPIEGNGDINGDGVVTDKDVIALLWHVLFPNAYPL